MSWAHKNSNLPIQDMLIAVPDDAHYFPFDHHLASTKLVYPEGWDNHTVTDYGLYTGTNLCATLRKGEGKFGGTVAIEESTENILYSNQSFSLPFSGLTCSVSRTAIEENRRWRVVTGNLIGSYSFGSFRLNLPLEKLVNGETYCVSYKYRDISGNSEFSPGDLCDNEFADQVREIDYGRYKYVYAWQSRSEYNSIFRFIDFYMKPHSEIEIWDVQVEQKEFPTSFVDGTRPDGILAYPLVLPKDHTIICYRKGQNDADYRHIAKRSDGTVFVDSVEDSEYDVGWIAGRNLLEGNWDLTWEDSHPSYQYLLRPQIQSIIDKVSIGDTLTFSFDVEAEADTLLLVYDSNGHPGIGFGSQSINVKQGKQRVSFTKTLVAGSKNTEQWYMDVYNNNNGVKFSISKIKIEKGSTATDWTPAPEDLGYDGDTLMLSNQTGLVDELMISRGVLSPEEIRAIYHSQRPLYDPNRIDHVVG